MKTNYSKISSLDDIIITDELSRRISKAPNLQAENQALHTLAQQMVQPQTMLESLVTMAMNLCNAGTAGISLLEVTPSGEEVFRCVVVAGALKAYEGEMLSRNFSMCGICLDRGTTQLYLYPERYFTYFKQAEPVIVEELVIPLLTTDAPVGALWIVSHDSERKFDQEDVRVMNSLGNFTTTALYLLKARDAAQEVAQRERAARIEAEQANRVKDEFLAMVSHELQTPLVAILGWSRSLRTSPFDQDSFLKSLETIERNAKIEAKLVEDLLDISRIASGKIRLNLSPVELKSVIEAAIATLHQTAQTKGIRLNSILDPLASSVLGDSERLQQVVSNLLANAIKFTLQGGKIEIRLDYVDSQAQIQVSDTGQGIPADLLPHVFERFRQAESSCSSGGLGLGLAIAHYLVELHGGTIHAASPGVGQGSTFTIKLPLIATIPGDYSLRAVT